MKRLTSAQKARRRGRNNRGGKTRQQRLREKLQQKRRRLRENNLVELNFGVGPVKKYTDGKNRSTNSLAVYGVHKAGTGNSWILTGLACTDSIEKISQDRTRYSKTEVRGRYVLTNETPRKGVEIGRFDTKREALAEVGADGSERVTAGSYLIRPRHNPTREIAEVDQDEFRQFKHDARRLWLD